VPGETTTGANLLRLFQPRAETVAMPFDLIREAICEGQVEAGVLIHEELLAAAESGLHRVACLGERWLRETGEPLPVGLNVIRTSLGEPLCRRFASYLRESIAYAMARPREAFEWASRYARSTREEDAWRFTGMFANYDTLEFGPDCERGLRLLFRRLHRSGLAPRTPAPSFVEPLYATFPSAIAGGVSP
jgi:1,4-dihydroxy-6-naphthoate synthase